MKDLHPNGPPQVGSVAIFNYNGTPHYAHITEFGSTTFRVHEANYIPGLIAYRDVRWNDPSLIGFWNPPTSHYASTY